MNLSIEQIFYGRGIYGYGILGVSPGGRSFASRVEALCGMVGTPGVDYGGEPFLISVPESDHVVMVCGRRGASDSMGRSTLFFHALVAGKAEMADANADAFSLFEQGLFADEIPAREIAALSIDLKSADNAYPHPENFVGMTVPCVIRSDKPQFDLVRAAVGDQALALSWATLAFQPMRNFDVIVLPPRASCQRNVNEYDSSGRIIRSVATTRNSKEAVPPHKCPDERPFPSSGQTVSMTPKGNPSAMFVVSVAFNIVLAVVCAALLATRRSAIDSSAGPATPIVVTNFVDRVVEKIVPAQLTDEKKLEIEEAAIKQYRSELRDRFPDESSQTFLNFNKTASELFIKYYGSEYNAYNEENKKIFRKEHYFLSELEKGIEFVNTEILKKGTP